MALDKKQIALSIGGVIASGTIAYLIYKAEQRNSAANTAAQVAASQAAAEAAQNNSDEQAELLAQLPSLGGGGGGSVSGYSGASDTTPVDSSPTTDSESTLLASILSSLGGSLSTPVTSPPVVIPPYTGAGLDSEPTAVPSIPSQIAPLTISPNENGNSFSVGTGSSATNTYTSHPL